MKELEEAIKGLVSNQAELERSQSDTPPPSRVLLASLAQDFPLAEPIHAGLLEARATRAYRFPQ